MADELNKRMDEMLKAYADRRRQEAGPALELHPATRQMLQAEVTRTYKQAPQRSWLQRMITFWPRVAFAATCLAITLTLVLFVLPEKRLAEMAQTRTVESESLLRDSRVADKEKADNYRLTHAPAAPAPSTAPVLPPSSSLDQLALKNEADEVKAKSEKLAELRKDDNNTVRLMREEAANKPVARRSFANVTNTTAGVSSRARYAQQPVGEVQLGARLQTAQPIILNNFELEQVGNVVRVYDEDGSVYSGNVVLDEEVKKQRLYSVPQKPAAQSGGAAAGPTAGEQQVFFRAAGTNLRLNQQVSIEANILTVTNSLPGLAPADGVKQQQQQQRALTLTPQQTIQGRAQVGSNQQVIINAVPAQP